MFNPLHNERKLAVFARGLAALARGVAHSRAASMLLRYERRIHDQKPGDSTLKGSILSQRFRC